MIATFCVSVTSKTIFEFEIDAKLRPTYSLQTVNSTTDASDGDETTFCQGRNKLTTDVSRLEMACSGWNNLETFVDVYTQNSSMCCGNIAMKREICASFFTLRGE